MLSLTELWLFKEKPESVSILSLSVESFDLSQFLLSESISLTRHIFQGPLKTFALHLGKMRKKFGPEDSPIRTYLVTARGGREMGSRAIITLREWGLAIDEAFFMDGAPKGPILSKIQPHIFFDDALHNIRNAQDVGVPSALVPCDC